MLHTRDLSTCTYLCTPILLASDSGWPVFCHHRSWGRGLGQRRRMWCFFSLCPWKRPAISGSTSALSWNTSRTSAPVTASVRDFTTMLGCVSPGASWWGGMHTISTRSPPGCWRLFFHTHCPHGWCRSQPSYMHQLPSRSSWWPAAPEPSQEPGCMHQMQRYLRHPPEEL